MSGFMRSYIRVVDGFNRRLGRFTMYGIFVLIGILLWSSVTKTFFTAVALDAGNGAVRHGRLLHSRRALFDPDGLERAHGPVLRRLVARRKAWFDALTVFCLIFPALLYGGLLAGLFAGLLGRQAAVSSSGEYGSEEIGRLEPAPRGGPTCGRSR
jgi:hypothetical protein